MTDQKSTISRGAYPRRPWRTDRRRPQCLQPPPYRTTEGVVAVDRRSYLDRRSAWIRDYQIAVDDNDSL